MRWKIVKTVFFLSGFFCFLPLLYADNVQLKNGKMFVGEITAQTDDYVEIRLKVGKTRVSPADIQSIDRKELPAGFFEDENSPAASSGKSEAAETKNIEGSGDKAKQKKGFYSISLDVKYYKESEKDMVDVGGSTNLPNGALVYIFFKRLDSFIASCEVPVKNGKFSLKLGPFDKRLASGKYSVEADFIPYRQAEGIANMVKADLADQSVDILHAVFTLNIDKPDEPNLGEREVKSELLSTISELQALREDLRKAYVSDKASSDIKRWNRWSDDWLAKLRKVEAKIKERSEQEFPLFPHAQENMKMAVRYLSALYTMNGMDIKDPVKFSKIAKDPDARASPHVVDKCFKDAMSGALKEVNSK